MLLLLVYKKETLISSLKYNVKVDRYIVFVACGVGMVFKLLPQI